MSAHARSIAAIVVFAGAAMTGVMVAQGAATPAPQAPAAPAGQTPTAQAPAGQTPAGQTPATPPAGGRGRQGGAPTAGAPAPTRRGGFTQFTRPIASQDVLVRGKSLYEANCASCHASDLRGGTGTGPTVGPNLLHSGMTLSDKQGELVVAAVSKHTPPISLGPADTVAIGEYIHSILATGGGQGSPPGRNPTGSVLNVLVGDAAAGKTAFGSLCASCHSVTGDLKGIGSKYSDARDLQNTWVAGSAGMFAGGGRGGGGGGSEATVTMADGSKVTGTLVRKNDFMVILILPDGTRKTILRNDDLPKVDVKDPQEAHKAMILKLDDLRNKNMHDITAYLATIK
jgi:cytochrome c oxidase cbb3-type subunit 3